MLSISKWAGQLSSYETWARFPAEVNSVNLGKDDTFQIFSLQSAVLWLISQFCFFFFYGIKHRFSGFMGIVESRPEPLIDHLSRAMSQPWEHRWRQFSCMTGRGVEPDFTPPRPQLRADCLGGRIFLWWLLLLKFFSELRSHVSFLFISDYPSLMR